MLNPEFTSELADFLGSLKGDLPYQRRIYQENRVAKFLQQLTFN